VAVSPEERPVTTILSNTPAALDVSLKLAKHAANLEYDQLPNELVELTKLCIIDTLGVIIGASTLAPEARMLADYAAELGGTPQSTLLGFGGRYPAPLATLVNGSMGHMLDYDDLGGGGHVSIATVPPAFAIAERQGGVSGRDLIVAIAAGADVMARIGRAVPIPDWTMSEGWFATQLFGYISAAATAGRLISLDEGKMVNALGIAFNQLSGSRQMAVGEATHMRSMQAGFSGQGGVTAALLAQRGVTGPKEILEGRYGLFKTYVRADEPHWDAVVDGLGTRFSLLETHGFKLWPSCAYTRPTNAAIFELRREGIRPEDVESITIVGGSSGTRLLSEPIESKRRPKASIDAKYSIPFTTAVAMAKGNVTLRAYTDEGLNDVEVLAMADRVNYRPAQSSSRSPDVELVTRDGRLITRRADVIPGDPRAPLGRGEIVDKFRDCVSFSAKPIPQANVERALELIDDLENLEDATEVVRLLA
jgi:2-methylcitrate dehydratase PrpD